LDIATLERTGRKLQAPTVVLAEPEPTEKRTLGAAVKRTSGPSPIGHARDVSSNGRRFTRTPLSEEVGDRRAAFGRTMPAPAGMTAASRALAVGCRA
jgi:hypothetical protein